MESLEKCSEEISLQPGDVLLSQNEMNQHLYFLIKGELHVVVDNGVVASLKEVGDLIGEMSLISQKKSSAEIKASSETLVLKVDGPELHKIFENNNTGSWNLYKIYTDILIHKLEITNQKAKKIEGFVEELERAKIELQKSNSSLESKVEERTNKISKQLKELQQKNVELVASHKKISDLYQSRDVTFQALDQLLEQSLKPLSSKISTLGLNASDGLEKNLRKAINRLEPLTTSFLTEKSMNTKKVLFAESVKKQQAVAKMALGGTGVSLKVVGDVEKVEDLLKEEKYDIFLYSEDFIELANKIYSDYPDMKMVFVASKEIPQYVSTILGQNFIPNIIIRDEEDKQFTIKNFVTTVSKLASGNYFGLEKYMAWGVETKEIEVSSSGCRSGVIEKVDNYFDSTGIRSSNRTRMSTVLEELLMNAIYDAPRDSDGNPIYNHKDRTEKVELKESHRPMVRYATDGVFMAVSVEDPFGALDARTLFRYLEKCYTSKESLNDGDKDKGGGGRGLHQIIENSDLVVFNIDFGKRTEVIALFNADPKIMPERNPGLHFFKV